MSNSTNIHAASQQWASRPDDERYLSLDALKTAVSSRKAQSWTLSPRTRDLRIVPDNDTLKLSTYDPSQGETRLLEPSHWAFGQLAQYAQAPAAYLRKLPAELAAINLQYGLERDPLRDDALLLGQSNGVHRLRSLTSQTYGRIWDSQVVQAVENVNQDDRWQIPAASYTAKNPKRATTLYASDRDVFIFLVDPNNPIEVNGETLFRGFYTWNSEVGAAVFGLCTFLYRYVCDNRIIWGATEVNELRIRHTGGAPERFAYEGARYLTRYAEESTYKTVKAIEHAQTMSLGQKPEDVQDWLTSRGFTAAIAKQSIAAAQAEEGQARSLWDIVNGITAHARTIPHTDERVKLETAAGKLMALAAE